MLTRPEELADETIVGALASQWAFDAATLEYRPVGFGSHHWRAEARDGDARFVTVDDLDANLASTPVDTADAAFDRLARAFRAAHAVSTEARLGFVVAPLPTRDGNIAIRPTRRYAMVVHPYLDATPAGDEGEFDSDADRFAVLDCVAELHGGSDVAASHAGVELGFLPGRTELLRALADVDAAWSSGPYAEPARALLHEHAAGVRRLLAHYDDLVRTVRTDPASMVFTHGEPHANNVLLGRSGPLLVDWESALMAPPERDLFGLDTGDGAVLAAYTAATGVAVSDARLEFYRLWYDLFEVAGYVVRFRTDHRDSEDAAASWRNLVDFLQPEARWPALFA